MHIQWHPFAFAATKIPESLLSELKNVPPCDCRTPFHVARLGVLQYSLQSVDNQYRVAVRRTFSASFSSAGTRSLAKKLMIGSIQHSLTIVTSEMPTLALILGYATNLTFINQGISLVDDDVNVAKESVCQFCPLAT